MNQKYIEELVLDELRELENTLSENSVGFDVDRLARRIANVIHAEVKSNVEFVIDILKDQIK